MAKKNFEEDNKQMLKDLCTNYVDFSSIQGYLNDLATTSGKELKYDPNFQVIKNICMLAKADLKHYMRRKLS